jgi:hypothetical protein
MVIWASCCLEGVESAMTVCLAPFRADGSPGACPESFVARRLENVSERIAPVAVRDPLLEHDGDNGDQAGE